MILPQERKDCLFDFAIDRGKIVAIDLLADLGRLGELDLAVLGG